MSTLAQPTPPRFLWLIWTSVLLAPLAWSASLVGMFWLTDPVCQGASRTMIVAIGGACVVLAIVSSLLAQRSLRRVAAHESSDFRTFLLRLAVGSSAIFALVIALSLVPVAMLTPCPV
jgi:F0F1-type ATP synthase membrane subunit c/vacuolar-type H+-ATPase subunit K